MSTDTTATEAKTETIATQQENVDTSIESTEVDYESKFAEKDAEIAQLAKEKENYRKAYLKNSKTSVEDDNSTEGEDVDSKVKRLVHEELLRTKEAKAQAERDALVKDLAKKNKELTLALKNRAQVTSNTGQGSNQDKNEVKTDSVLSNEQLASLKARGWDEKKIEAFKKNLNKVNQSPK